jgi:hypothetical protein
MCSECGALLEPVTDLSELFGYRTMKPLDRSADPERWFDDDDPIAIAVALPIPGAHV